MNSPLISKGRINMNDKDNLKVAIKQLDELFDIVATTTNCYDEKDREELEERLYQIRQSQSFLEELSKRL